MPVIAHRSPAGRPQNRGGAIGKTTVIDVMMTITGPVGYGKIRPVKIGPTPPRRQRQTKWRQGRNTAKKTAPVFTFAHALYGFGSPTTLLPTAFAFSSELKGTM